MKKISTHNFKYTLRDIHKNTESRKFCFVLGAGASYKSGIPTGGQLADKWYKEIQERYLKKEFEEWGQAAKIDENDLAASYGSIYRKRFESDKTSGYEFLVQTMKTAKPSFGHIVLAQILSKSPGHTILTTNFDSLIESSIYQFTNKTPLVCGHESLSGYARPSRIHPLIIKIHRDLLLSPKSDPDEISKLDEGWKEPLDQIFSNHIPIVIGYGGNDGSLMTYFEQMNRPSNFFWCCMKGSEVPNRVQQLIEKMDGSFVTIEGFDKIMQELLWVFDEIKPINEELDNITKARIDTANKQLLELTTIHTKRELDEDDSERELSAYEYSKLADNEPDFEKRKTIYLEALEKFPNTAWLWNAFTYFLHFVKRDYEGLKQYYIMALAIDPDDDYNNLNYAVYLSYIEEDRIQAEKHFLKALEISPEDGLINHLYANFLFNVKREYEEAEKYFKKALSIDPNDSQVNGAYAFFLQTVKQDYKAAEKYFKKALSIDPNNAEINGFYALFLKDAKKDYEQARTYYRNSLSLDAEDANQIGNFSQLLIIMGESEKAKEHLDEAFKLNQNKKRDLLVELWFYSYAHYYEDYPEAKERIIELLDEGIQSINWNLQDNVNKAIDDGHPDPKELQTLANKITTLVDR